MLRLKELLGIGFIALLVAGLSGCLPNQEQEEIVEPDDPAEQVQRVTPTVQITETHYAGLSPLQESPTRHLINERLRGYRLDQDRLELGLLEIAQEYFPPDNYLFVGGQLISRAEGAEWLKEATESPESLNPAEAPSHVLQHILEHNYLALNGQDLQGVVIGLSLVSSYEVEREDGTKQTLYYTADQLRNYGFAMADELAQRLRAKVQDVPIVIALYQLEESQAYRPGNFLSVGYVEPHAQEVSEWRTINEVYLLFPSPELSRLNSQLSSDYNSFVQRIQDFFPRYVGVVGTGRFVNEELVELNLEVTTEFASIAEVIQLTQYLGSEAMETFPENIYLNIYVGSVNDQKALFTRSPGSEPFIHVNR
ncbi:protein involved in sex pheromone biosynthesis [Caldalkalibacillus uzonensis]|uniref:Protein involved in sex pheromone biosynthesis n=1 Tax=Caldalkalibacillus uzonensis TaxID=353224 RepID=A0ABU0CXI4_9BACI|nr:CamS family sex pheromone protein [Caldalkalibacillus uzonensis]MDQ0340097.1 protein involved in sex pheromone biosynthesis [Caldalkalibacillus uzonensis]